MLTVSALNQFYGGSHILWDVSMTVPKGSRTCLMGRNGMGKTTLLKCVMGLLPAASGTIGAAVITAGISDSTSTAMNAASATAISETKDHNQRRLYRQPKRKMMHAATRRSISGAASWNTPLKVACRLG